MTVQIRILVAFVMLAAIGSGVPEASGQTAAEGPPQAMPANTYHLVPYPARLEERPGAFYLDSTTVIALARGADDELVRLGELCAEIVEDITGITVAVSEVSSDAALAGVVLLALSADDERRSPEGYRLEVGDEGIAIVAQTHAGVFYGLQTLRQLLQGSLSPAPGVRQISGMFIEDAPRFVYRGMHLDVGRHFFPVEFVKKYIDLLAMYKMNTFHWHLTEDQGWRIEIKKYPRLTEVGAFRKETILEKNFDPYVGDRIPYGGFYTQDEIREVVAHAQRRYVTIIPEIEMPGHSKAALAAYPELACTEGPFEVATVWGVHEDIYCPSETTFAFLQDVLTEVIDLFPGRYIHIGGDEAPKKRWEESQLAQDVMRREGLADEHQLQSYFIKRIEEFLLARGRRLIGWDEILEGGLAPQATVMSWRGTEGGIEAARQGHDVIMTPTSHVYFDYYQGDRLYEPLAIGGFTPLEKVYAFDPVPEELTVEESKHVLGAQGNVWTEYMKTPQYVEYMVFPRLLALSEVVWSPAEVRDWGRFAGSLSTQFKLLDRKRVNYRVPHVRGLERDRLTLADQIEVSLESLLPEAEIRYTTDASDPSEAATLYSGPFQLPVDSSGVEVRARAYLPNGRTSSVRAARFAKTHLRPAESLAEAELAPGLRYSYYEADVASVRALASLTPVRTGTAREVALSGDERAAGFGLEFQGYIRVPEPAVYTFRLESDDGSQLGIAGRTVIDNDGYHVSLEKTAMIALEAGYHPISVRYFQAGGGKVLQLDVRSDELEELDLEGALFHRK